MAVTIHDLARELKLSSATVSRALNDGPINAKTKARVLQAVERHSYVPDARARSLKGQPSNKVGFIVPDIRNPIYPIAITAAHDLLKARGYFLLVGNTYGESEEERRHLERMSHERVAGVFIATCEDGDPTQLCASVQALCKQGIHPILLGKPPGETPFDVVTIDNYTGSRMVLDHLKRTGRRRIGFIAGRRGRRVTEERLAGWRENCQPGTPDELALCEGSYTVENGKHLARKLLNDQAPDAIFCGNDLLAIGVLSVAAELGLRVPEDLAIVGFDDIPMATWVTPQLTTVRLPLATITSLACELLFRRIHGPAPDAPEELLVKPELIVRGSA